VRLAIIVLGMILMRASLGDLRPCPAVFIVEIEPACEILSLVSVWTDRIGWTLWLADAAVYALVWVDHQHVFAFVETVHWAYLHTVHVFAFDAVVYDHVCHC
jgi:hypothetical protein